MPTDEQIIEFIKTNGPSGMNDIEREFPNCNVYSQVRRLWNGGHGILKRKNFYYSVNASFE